MLNQLTGNALVFFYTLGQRQTPFLSREKIQSLQNSKLRKLVDFASRTVPYYQDLFRNAKIRPHDIHTADDLASLPVLTRDVVQQDPERFVSNAIKPAKLYRFTTSGTTGSPLSFYHDQRSLLANIAYGERERAALTEMCKTTRIRRELAILYPGNTSRKVWDIYNDLTFIPIRPQRMELSVLDPIMTIVDTINRFRPEAIFSYGSFLESFFKTVAQQNRSLYRPSVVIYGADNMTEPGKRFIEERMNIPVFSQYNAIEAFKIGFFCEEGNGFHLHEDLCHVRVVDPRGKTLEADQTGQIVITNLVNRGTVLLNYLLNDLAAISTRSCPCGRTFQVLSGLQGREEDIITLDEGKFIHPRAIWSIFKNRYDVLRYQLIQHEKDQFHLRLVMADEQADQSSIEDIVDRLMSMLTPRSVIETSFHKSLDINQSGKFRPVLSHYRHRLK